MCVCVRVSLSEYLHTCVSTECVQTLSSLAVGSVDVAVSSSGADEDGPPTLWPLHEGQVSDGAVMHAELKIRAYKTHTPPHQ